MAMLKVLEKGFEAERADDVVFDLDEFFGSEFFPARADWSVVAEAAEKELDFGEGETHFAGEANKQDAVEGVRGIAALTASTVWRGGQGGVLGGAGGGGIGGRGGG